MQKPHRGSEECRNEGYVFRVRGVCCGGLVGLGWRLDNELFITVSARLLRWIHYGGRPGNIRVVKENTTTAVKREETERCVCVCPSSTWSCPGALVERWPCHGNNVLGITIWWNPATRVLSCPLEWQLVAAGTATQGPLDARILTHAHTTSRNVFLLAVWSDTKQTVERLG